MIRPRLQPAAPHLFLLPVTIWLGALLVAPLAIVVVYSLAERGLYGTVTLALSLRNYVQALDPLFLPVLLRSVKFAGLMVLLTLALGYPLAYYVAMRGGSRKNILLILIILPFWTSYLIRTYAWIVILRTEGVLNVVLQSLGIIQQPLALLNTQFSVLLGLTYGFLPFMALPIYVSLEKIDRALLEAASDLGANPAATFGKVVLPLSLPGVVAGTTLTFVPGVGDFVAADLLGGPHTYMVGNLIQNQFLQAQNWPFGSALSILLMGIMLVAMTVYVRLAGAEAL